MDNSIRTLFLEIGYKFIVFFSTLVRTSYSLAFDVDDQLVVVAVEQQLLVVVVDDEFLVDVPVGDLGVVVGDNVPPYGDVPSFVVGLDDQVGQYHGENPQNQLEVVVGAVDALAE